MTPIRHPRCGGGYHYDNQWESDAEIRSELDEVDRALKAEARSPVWLRLSFQGPRRGLATSRDAFCRLGLGRSNAAYDRANGA